MAKLKAQEQIRARIDAFASELTELVHQAALEAVEEVLGGGKPAVGTRTSTARPGRPRKAAGGTRGKKKTAAKQGRRTSEDLEKLSAEVLAHVKANPGHRLEQIAAAMGVASAELKKPIIDLLADGKLRKTGQKRGTKYYVGSGRGRKKAAKKAGKRSAKKAARRKTTKTKRTAQPVAAASE